MEDNKQKQNDPLMDLFKSMNDCIKEFYEGIYIKNENQKNNKI